MSWTVNLSGETSLVTGGSRNIGLAIAEALQRAGANVCIVARSDEATLNDATARLNRLPSDAAVMSSLVDVADETTVVDLYDRIEKQLGPLTILVNGAANRPHEPFTELSRESWTEVIDTILTGAFLTSRELFRRLPEGRKAAIVNIGGLSAHRPAKDRAHVIAAKSGLLGLTRALAQEGLGRIRANAVVPGTIQTKRRPCQSSPTFDQPEGVALTGSSEDVARAVLPFCDPKDIYVTGQTLHVNGGRYMP